MTLQVAIRSYQREQLLAKKTLSYLQRAGISRQQITIFVASDSERRRYQSAVGSDVGCFVVTGVGAREAFNGVLDHYDAGEKVVMVDDDLECIVRKKTDKSWREVDDLQSACREGFRLASRVGAPVWGVYPTHNAMFMRHDVDIGLRKLPHAVVGLRVRDDLPRIELPELHEHEWSIKCWKKYGAVVRLAYLAPKTTPFAYDGGNQAMERKKVREQCQRKALQRWPDLLDPDTHSGSGMPDLKMPSLGPISGGRS